MLLKLHASLLALTHVMASPFYEFKALGPFYSVPIHIGMPPQEVNVTIDTTGLTTFVYADLGQCSSGSSDTSGDEELCQRGFDRTQVFCDIYKTIPSRKSNSFHSTLQPSHFESPLGTAEGIMGEDVLTVSLEFSQILLIASSAPTR
jgi:hypothetical protein